MNVDIESKCDSCLRISLFTKHDILLCEEVFTIAWNLQDLVDKLVIMGYVGT